jgi:hypothetical protein
MQVKATVTDRAAHTRVARPSRRLVSSWLPARVHGQTGGLLVAVLALALAPGPLPIHSAADSRSTDDHGGNDGASNDAGVGLFLLLASGLATCRAAPACHATAP